LSAFALLPAAARAQGRLAKIGLLAGSDPPPKAVQALRDSLRQAGYVEGRNLALNIVWPTASSKPLSGLAQAVVRGAPDLIVAWSTPAALAARDATSTIPIVVVGIADPVGVGLAESLARPGKNITGFTNLGSDLSAKQVQVFVDGLPGVEHLGVIYGPASPAGVLQLRGSLDAIARFKLRAQAVGALTESEYRRAIVGLHHAGVGGILFIPDPTTIEHRAAIAQQALAERLPTMFQRRENIEAGGLMSYGPDLTDQFRQVASYIERILKGAKASELPIQQPNKIELVINQQTARALGYVVPPALLARADEVIE
jgi:putative ABC transport system substrate-binding protein